MAILLSSIAANVLEKAIPLFPNSPHHCKIICIPTASKVEEEPKNWLHDELAVFQRTGFDLTMVDIDGMSEEDVASALKEADVVYVTGGNTFFLLEKMKACNFEKIIKEKLAQGCVYIGSSAGTVVCCPDIDYVKTMDAPDKARLDNTIGLNIVDFFVMVHMDNASFAKKAYAKILSMKTGTIPVICLNDNQALFVDGKSISII